MAASAGSPDTCENLLGLFNGFWFLNMERVKGFEAILGKTKNCNVRKKKAQTISNLPMKISAQT